MPGRTRKAKTRQKPPAGAERLGRCADCPGTIYAVRQHGRVFSWCDGCTPVVTMRREALEHVQTEP